MATPRFHLMIVLLIVLLVINAAFLMIAFNTHRVGARLKGKREPSEQK